ncbi:MAG: cation:proton antiporter [Hyphomonadaceae bacterium]
MENYGLILTICAAIVLAFIAGVAMRRIGLSPILGYLLAGVAMGPFTPGFVGDINLAMQLAEIGVILLMFGVGLKFSLADLWAVRLIAVPGALVQMCAATGLGYLFGTLIGLPLAESLMLGFSLSVASTVVLLRELEDRRLIKSQAGQISVGWLVMEDLAIVLAIVLLPMLAANADAGFSQATLTAIGVTLLKIAGFAALMLIVGARVFPWLIMMVAHLKSRELLSLGTLALALGMAAAAYFVFDTSFALGAFLAGVALNSTKFSQKIAEDSQPFRDTFAVLFFVSVGMLFDPSTLLRSPVEVAVVVAIIVLGKGVAALLITSAFRLPLESGLMVAAALAQIGEFSFVLAGMGRALDLMSSETYNVILAGALISIALNPFLFRLIRAKPEPAPAP